MEGMPTVLYTAPSPVPVSVIIIWQAFHFAASNDDLELLVALIEKGGVDVHEPTRTGMTTLNAAITKGSKRNKSSEKRDRRQARRRRRRG